MYVSFHQPTSSFLTGHAKHLVNSGGNLRKIFAIPLIDRGKI